MAIAATGMAISAILTGLVSSKFIGQLTQVVIGEFSMAAGHLILAYATATGVAAFGYFVVCFGTGFAIVVSASLISRLLAAYELDPRDYSEWIAAAIFGLFALGYGGGAQVGCALVDAFGYETTEISFAIATSIAPAALVVLLSPMCLGGRAI